MKLFGNRKGAEHIAARKTEKKPGGLKRWQRVTIIVAAIGLILGGTALAVYKANVKPPVKQPEPVETEPLPEEETVKKPTVYVPTTEVDEETGEVFLFEREPHGRFQGPELADAFARAALAQDAEVFELAPEKIPGDSGMAALYRY